MMKKKIKKEVIEWIALITVFGIIYLTGWHTEVIGRMQQAVLSTGIIQPELVEEERKASYNFWVEDFEGNKIQFSEFEGEVVFLNFWATWCPPCVAEMPDIHDLYGKQNSKVTFVMISLDSDEKKAREFIKRKEFEFPVYFLRSTLPDTYETHSIPTTYVIDKEGFLKVENHGMAKYDTDSFVALLDNLAEGQ